MSAPPSYPIVRGAAVTPHDTNDIAPTRALWVGGAGAVAVILVDDTDPVTFSGVTAGTLLPFAVRRVLDTGTDATLILALR